MNRAVRPRLRRAAMLGLCSGALATLIAGCQSYERVPLDFAAHQVALATRLDQSESIDAFGQRLAAQGALVPDQFDPTDGLTRAEAEVLALFYNADLRLARLEAGAALATFENAGLWEDPEFGFDGAEIVSPSAPFQFGLTLSLTIPISGRLGIEKDRAGAAYEAELRQIVAAEWATRAQVRRAWGAWTAAEERAALLRDIVAQVERINVLTDQLEAAGELNRVEGRLFRIERSVRRAALADAELTKEQARLVLLKVVGLPPQTTVVLLPELVVTEPSIPADPAQRLIESNTKLAIRRAEYLVAEESLRLEVRKQFPDITIGPGYGSEAEDDRLLLGVSLPLPLLNANRGGIAEARAKRDISRASAETIFEQLSHDFASAQAIREAVRVQRDRYEAEVVPMLVKQSQEVEQIASLGEVDTLLLLETVTRQFEAKSRLLELRLAESNAVIAIAELLGPEPDFKPAPADAASDTTIENPQAETDISEGDAP